MRYFNRPSRPLISVLSIILVITLSPMIHPLTRRNIISAVRPSTARTATKSSDGLHTGAGDEAILEWEYRRALVYEGTDGRVRRFLEKAQRGEGWVLAVIGGSVSKGRGLDPPWTQHGFGTDKLHADTGEPVEAERRRAREPRWKASDRRQIGAETLYSPQNFPVLIFDWLNATFPHKDNRLVNGAQGGVGAGYFGWCFSQSLSQGIRAGMLADINGQRNTSPRTWIWSWLSWVSRISSTSTSWSHTSV